MTTPEEVRTIQSGFPETDQLLDDSRITGEKIRVQAETLATLSAAALTTIESPVNDHYLPNGWPLTSAAALQERLMAKAQANLAGEEESAVARDEEQSVSLDQFSLGEASYWLSELRSVYDDRYLSTGYPPTGAVKDVIKWTAELANNDWLVVAKVDIATDRREEVGISVYPENDTTRGLLDESLGADGEYRASQWLSHRVIMHAYKDEFDRFDWTVPESELAIK